MARFKSIFDKWDAAEKRREEYEGKLYSMSRCDPSVSEPRKSRSVLKNGEFHLTDFELFGGQMLSTASSGSLNGRAKTPSGNSAY